MMIKFERVYFYPQARDCSYCASRPREGVPRRVSCPQTPADIMRVKISGECPFKYYRVEGAMAGYRFFVFKEKPKDER